MDLYSSAAGRDVDSSASLSAGLTLLGLDIGDDLDTSYSFGGGVGVVGAVTIDFHVLTYGLVELTQKILE